MACWSTKLSWFFLLLQIVHCRHKDDKDNVSISLAFLSHALTTPPFFLLPPAPSYRPPTQPIPSSDNSLLSSLSSLDLSPTLSPTLPPPQLIMPHSPPPSPLFNPLSRFDGRFLYSPTNTKLLQLSNYLGGGAAGVVYAATLPPTLPTADYPHNLACKILNPTGYRLLPNSVINTSLRVLKGIPVQTNVS